MAKKISQLTQATQVKSDDVTVIVQDGETKKLPLNMMVTKQDIENKKVAGLAKLDEIEATYENDTYTPTITVKNKSFVKVGEGDGVDYSANVMDGSAKSAILKGETLVNLMNENERFNASLDGTNPSYWAYKYFTLTQNLKPSTNYTLIFNATITQSHIIHIGGKPGNAFYSTSLSNVANGVNKFLLKTYSEITDKEMNKLFIQSNNSKLVEITLTDFILVEGDYTNTDIPYFTGMQSVKLPVLTTTGKNLLNFNSNNVDKYYGFDAMNGYGEKNGIEVGKSSVKFTKKASAFGFVIKDLIPNTKYVLSYDVDNNSTMTLNNNYVAWKKHIFTTDGNGNSPKLSWGVYNDNTNNGVCIIYNIQIEEGSTATSYEPFKSNILTVNEDVALRGISDVQDTLDCLTGEVTERIGEIVLDGSEGWSLHSLTNEDYLVGVLWSGVKDVKKSTSNAISDKLIRRQSTRHNHVFYFTDSILIITFDKESVSSMDLKGLTDKLKTLKPTIYYELATESIKTVDLMPSGTHPSTTPYCWKNGHIQLSSSGLLPNLEYSVVTSRAGQINQNATMIVKNDKRIFDLEILLAGGLVNTTYQALTLQNQVETGLSKVSLNSETEPDYLLYHMIMKLIEEKAYKLDDLTEKVSVFYLYEKLSDEQFETIYSALYPFVEDEIIEEPVVEELPEVVEDEVIM